MAHGSWLVDIAISDLVFVTGTRVFVTGCNRRCHRFEIAESQW